MARAASGAPFSLCLVTDRRQTRGRPLLDVVHAALDGGADAVQLREKDLLGAELYRLATALRELTARYGATLLVNDRIDVALAAAADGAHLGQQGIPAAVARRLLGPGRLLGVSTHSAAEVTMAATAGADYVVFGPIYFTPSKADFGPPLGLGSLTAVAAQAPVPILAIGGVTADRVAGLRRSGAAGVAVISAISAAADPVAAARQLRRALDR
jgi:thiamine-phosphate pyrophosphorylase